jgi:hypothetical protein
VPLYDPAIGDAARHVSFQITTHVAKMAKARSIAIISIAPWMVSFMERKGAPTEADA